jgi:HAD superfamily hydrolase (TIGR01490 family)
LSASSTSGSASGGRVAAFFDVDGTLLTVQSGTLYIGYLRRRGLMSRTDQLRIYWAFLTYRLGFLNMRRLVDVTSRWLSEREEREVAEHCLDWYRTEVSNFFRPSIVSLVEEHRAAGHVVALLTGGTHYLNDHIAADLGIEHVIASKLEVVDGRFTGKPIPPLCYGRGKLVHAERFAAAHGVDLAGSYYYADSITDMPVLDRVGHPCAVHPDPWLRREVQKRGWRLVASGEGPRSLASAVRSAAQAGAVSGPIVS